MRKKIVAGNWKMNKTAHEVTEFIDKISGIKLPSEVNKIIIPPFPFLQTKFPENIHKGAQNVSEHPVGAFTGEISAAMLKSVGVEYCLVGHSERRKYFNEGNHQLFEKLIRLLENNINPIFCVGETIDKRLNNVHFDFINQQLEPLLKLNDSEITKVIIAYEPVWAIGTGKNASKEQAEEMHSFIRNFIAKNFNENIAQELPILYGGSCNSSNARELFSMPNVDGGLIGGASLSVDEFVEIINSACQ